MRAGCMPAELAVASPSIDGHPALLFGGWSSILAELTRGDKTCGLDKEHALASSAANSSHNICHDPRYVCRRKNACWSGERCTDRKSLSRVRARGNDRHQG